MRHYRVYGLGVLFLATLVCGFHAVRGQKFSIHFGEITGGKVSVEQAEVVAGARVVLKVEEEVDYALRVSSLTVERYPSGSPHPVEWDSNLGAYAFDMPGHDVLIKAIFVPRRIVRVWRDASQMHGEFRIDPQTDVAPGAQVRVRVIGLHGYRVVESSIEYSEDDAKSWKVILNGAFTMPEADVWVRARFAAPADPGSPAVTRYRVTVRVEGAGRLDVTHNGVSVATEAVIEEGTELRIEPKPDTGSRLVQLLVNGYDYFESTYRVQGDTEIRAIFALDTPTSVSATRRMGVYPNPAMGWLHVDAAGGVWVSLATISGVEVARYQLGGEGRVYVGDFPSGLYVARVVYADGRVESAMWFKH